MEIDAYPRFREGTYAYVSGAFAPSPSLFPQYRFAGDLYQSLGAGFEASVGYRRMQFTNAVNIYVGSLTNYRGLWMITGRMFLTPGLVGTSTSVHGIARRYWTDGVGYFGVRYGRGAYRDEVRSWNDIELLSSDSFGAELLVPIGTLELWVSTRASREGRAGRSNLWQFSTRSGLGVRFWRHDGTWRLDWSAWFRPASCSSSSSGSSGPRPLRRRRRPRPPPVPLAAGCVGQETDALYS